VTDPLALPLMAEYAAYHRDKRNRLCHEFGIPMIVLALIVFMRLAHYGAVDLATIAIVALSFYYYSLVRGAALGAIVGLAALYAIATVVSWPVAVGFFVAGWILQFVGHAYERKSPAFLTNLVHLLVGPLWISLLLTDRRTNETIR
jgi:uncharacterized membrane protein YGL010W